MTMRNVLLVAVLLAATAVRGDEFRPRVMLTWESRDSGLTSTSRLRQDIDVFLSRALTDTVTFRVNLGANHSQLDTDRPDLETPSIRAYDVRPSGALTAMFGRVTTETTYALRRHRSAAEGLNSRRDDEQMGTSVAWGSSRFVPGGSVRAFRYRLSDRASTAAIVNDFVSGSLEYRIGPLDLSAGQSYRADRDSRADYERITTDRTAGMTFAESWFGGRLALAAAASGAVTQIDDTSGTATRIPAFVPVSRALWGVDDTPLDSNDHPLSAYPTLTDSRISVPTGISFGPEAPSFQAIAFDVGRLSPVDQIQLVVRDERLDPVVNAEGIRWDVYVSIDGVLWTQHAADLVATFDEIRSIYLIDFEQTDARWIKVVNFGVASQQVLVTEAYLLFHTVREAGSNDAEFRTAAASASLTFIPIQRVTLSYNGSGYQSSQETGQSLGADVRDLLHHFSAQYDPSPRIGYQVRYELQDARTAQLEQDVRTAGASLRFAPRPQLSSALSCELRDEQLDQQSLDTRTCSANISAAIFPTLDLTVGASDREQTLDSAGSLRIRSYYAAATARVTSTLRLTLSGTGSRSALENWTGALVPSATDDRVSADIDWTRGRALALGGTFGYTRTDSFSGLVQRYRVRWSPFGDGAVSLTTNYTEDVDPYSNSRSRRLLFSPRWQINPRTALNLTYSSVSTTGDQEFDSRSILATLIFGR
jgi:hypothetical protein